MGRTKRLLLIKLLFLSVFCLLFTISFAGVALIQNFQEINNNGDSKFGYSVSTAGDVNNDGYNDLIIGAPEYNTFKGRAYIYFGSSSMDVLADITLTGETTYNQFGCSVSEAGDVNNDGYDDVIIGANRYNSYTGRAYVYFGGTAMDNTADVTMLGEATNNYHGLSVSGAVDVNNDGYDDVIVGAAGYNSSVGRAYIYFGGSSMDNTADVTMTGEVTSNNFGYSVSGAGDVNNDGYEDVLIGASSYSSNTGRAYVYFGSSSMDNVSDIYLTGEGYNNYFGTSVSGAGDVNNDGFDDVMVGAPYYSTAGRAYVYLGGSSMDNIADVIMTGVGYNHGYSLSGAGDVNNDGYDDVIVGAYTVSSNTGQAYIYFGSSSMDNTADAIISVEAVNNGFGYSVSGAGDVNNDGYDDVIIGENGYNYNNGRVHIYLGNPSFGTSFMNNTADITATGGETYDCLGFSVSGAGDVNNDGFDDVIVGAYGYNSYTGRAYVYFGGSPMDNTADAMMTGEAVSDAFGASVSRAGDLNNDGYDDVIVGASGYSSNTGRAYVFFGGTSMDNTADATMTGEATNNNFGRSVSGAGDVNNDGYKDVLVGANGYNSFTGRAYIYLGGASMDNTADATLTGEATNCDFGYSVSGAGDVNNDGYDDVIVGAYGYNSSTGRAYMYLGGSSMDASADWISTGEAIYNYHGLSVSGAGDVNGDGYGDVIVGSTIFSYEPGIYTDRAFLYFGSSTMDNTTDITMSGQAIYNNFVCSVSGAGDVNSDGYGDVIVGAYGYNSEAGRASVYFGGASMDNIVDIALAGEAPYDRLGVSVSGAGDVNNDGIDDVIVGAYGYNSFTGRVYVYLGCYSTDVVADIIPIGQGSSNSFGYSVSGVGDVNNDGYDDVIVGAFGYNSYAGRAYVYFGGSSMDNTADVVMTGEAVDNFFGYAASGAGDVNKDGYDDVIVGAYGFNSYTGRVYVYFGGSFMDNTADVVMTGAVANNRLGYSVSGSGDVNNDGYDDVIVGAQALSYPSTGRAYVYFGGSSMDNTADVIATGTHYSFGMSVSGAGDVNNDGYDDVIIGAAYNGSITGRAYVYYGGTSMDNTADAIMTGEATDNAFGFSVSGAGDVNSDGYDDVIVGAYYYNSYVGRVYMYFGGSSLDNTADVMMTGEATNNYFGYSVSEAGDVNNDGYDDVIVGASGYYSDAGQAYVYFGGSSMNNTADFILTGEGPDDQFGKSVSAAGDVNGDGINEMIVGNFNDKAYIYSIFLNTKLKIWLEGPYQAGGNMAISLKTAGYLPITSPYPDARIVKTVPDGVTDWISLEMRNSTSGLSLAQRSFFLKSNGLIVDTDGFKSDLKMPGLADGNYYLVVRHRNHLAVMSTAAVSLNILPASLFDFSAGLGQYFGGDAKLFESGVYGMYSGDANGSGTVDASDRSATWNSRNQSGYLNADCNLSETVDASDRSLTWNNRNKSTNVP